LLLFFAVTFVLVSLWPRLFPPPEVPEPTPGAEAATNVEPRAPGEPVPEPPEAELGTATDELPDESEGPEGPEGREAEGADARVAEAERTVVVETSLYDLQLTNRGGRLLSFRLHEYQDSLGGAYEMVSQTAAKQLNIRPLDIRLEDKGQTAAITKALYVLDAPGRVPLADGEERVVVLDWSDGQGLEVTKRLTLVGGTYRVGVDVSVRERGREVAKAIVYGPGVGDELTQSRYTGAEKGVIESSNEVALFAAGDLEDHDGAAGNIAATGVASHYFAALMLPHRVDAGIFGSRLELATVQVEEEPDPRRRGADDGQPELVDRNVITAQLLAPASPVELTLFVGPKKLELLEELTPGLGQIIEFGSWMRYPALVLRSWLLTIYDYVGNYGWSIVLLTLFINVLLIPLKHYSFVSMRKMQKIAPQTQKIRERYKKVKPTDPRYHEMNQEMQALYEEHGVNPVSGCLPMLLMIPFFFAFYRMLMASVELRQAPFVFWISDLAVHDPYFVLPILMGGTQLAIQKMTPQTSADPVEAKIMSFMPIMFTLLLAWAPAGLVLYWFSNNLVSMTQQKVTNRLIGDKDEEKGGKGGAAAKADDADSTKPVKSVKTGKKRKGKKGR